MLRQPIYEKDRIDPVDPAAKLSKLDTDMLKLFPEGYRHLAYLQHKIGYKVKRDMPGLDGPEARGALRQGPKLATKASHSEGQQSLQSFTATRRMNLPERLELLLDESIGG